MLRTKLGAQMGTELVLCQGKKSAMKTIKQLNSALLSKMMRTDLVCSLASSTADWMAAQTNNVGSHDKGRL